VLHSNLKMQNGIPSMQDLQKQAEREQQELQMSEQKQMILDQIMEPQARERLV
jgi:DNA-binding TFAR19-related protein (PDSD5 family)